MLVRGRAALFLAFFSLTVFAEPTAFFIWKVQGQSYLLSRTEGETAREATQRYVSRVKNHPLLFDLSQGVPGPNEGKILEMPRDLGKTVLITENTPLKHVAETKAFESKGATVLIRPMGIDITRSDIENRAYQHWVNQHIGAILVPGGADVDPVFYGEPVKGAKDFNHVRDRGELEFIRDYYKRSSGKIYGFCRGHQLISVMMGLTLIQDIPSEVGVKHHATGSHQVDLIPMKENPLKSILGSETPFESNTFHHQAVDPASMTPSSKLFAIATNGVGDQKIIEAIASKDGRILTVQFHPEWLMHTHVGDKIVSKMVEGTSYEISTNAVRPSLPPVVAVSCRGAAKRVAQAFAAELSQPARMSR